jgi:hypothetical protein
VSPSLHAQGGGGSQGGGGGGIPLGGGGGGHAPTEEEKSEARKNAKERPLKGVVTDADGNPVPGALVQLKNTKTQQVRTLTTREKGDYLFTGLSKDIDYQVKAIFKDQASEPHTLSTFDNRAQPVVNLQLK